MANKNIDTNIFPDKDFRTKSWQHSSPAFWGSMIITPDDQHRQYHPYQLAVLPVSSGMTSSPMDNIGRNGTLGITSEGEQVSFASVLELPVHPPFSLAGFAGMRLQPGWYKAEASGEYATQGALRRMQYQAGVPGVGIGNSFGRLFCFSLRWNFYRSYSYEPNAPCHGYCFSCFLPHLLGMQRNHE